MFKMRRTFHEKYLILTATLLKNVVIGENKVGKVRNGWKNI